MKKITTTLFAVLVIVSLAVPVMAEPEKIVREVKEVITGGKQVNEKFGVEAGVCPKTNVKGEVHSCMRCHVEKSMKLKEVLPFEELDLPNGQSHMVIENDETVGLFDVRGIDGYVSERLEDFLRYLYTNHPKVTKIVMEIQSPGGSLFDAYKTSGIVKLWKSKGFTFETRVHGFAASAGFYLFCLGDVRLANPHSEGMWHELRTFKMFSLETPSSSEEQSRILRHLQDNANSLIASICKLTKEEVDEKIKKKEWWMTGMEMFELGIATGLLK
jgi:ATP-dependent protease ClpP protease subunit